MYKFIPSNTDIQNNSTFSMGMIPVFHDSSQSPNCWVISSELLVINQTTGFRINIPAGFTYDLASVPWAFTRILPKAHPLMFKAATVHDYLYWKHIGTKEEADNIFYEIMVQEGMPLWKAKAAYQAVNLFGQSAWDGE